MKLLVEAGEFADEIWAFVGAKQRRAVRPGDGDIWTFTAVDADTRLIVSRLVGPRTVENAIEFMKDIRSRVTRRIQLATHGHSHYEVAVREAFRFDEVDWAMLPTQYGTVDPDKVDAAHRYSPPVCTGAQKIRKIGTPDPDLVSTSYVERSNLTLRMQQRRFTRLTNAFSKKAENHAHAVSLFFLYYNYCRPHQTLTQEASGVKTTPAMAAGLADRVWTVDDIVTPDGPHRAQHRRLGAKQSHNSHHQQDDQEHPHSGPNPHPGHHAIHHAVHDSPLPETHRAPGSFPGALMIAVHPSYRGIHRNTAGLPHSRRYIRHSHSNSLRRS